MCLCVCGSKLVALGFTDELSDSEVSTTDIWDVNHPISVYLICCMLGICLEGFNISLGFLSGFSRVL